MNCDVFDDICHEDDFSVFDISIAILRPIPRSQIFMDVKEAPSRVGGLVSTIADEDLSAHFSPMSQRLGKYIQSLERRYYPNGLVVGETELSPPVEPLVPEAGRIRQELIDELRERDSK